MNYHHARRCSPAEATPSRATGWLRSTMVSGDVWNMKIILSNMEDKKYNITPERLAQSRETRVANEVVRQAAFWAKVNKLRREHACLLSKSHDEIRALIDRALILMLTKDEVTLGTIDGGRFYFKSKDSH